jgi:hypothetical protein
MSGRPDSIGILFRSSYYLSEVRRSTIAPGSEKETELSDEIYRERLQRIRLRKPTSFFLVTPATQDLGMR